MIPDTALRVQKHTAPHVNERIRQETASRISAFRSQDRIALINRRLAELDREWDVERVLQTNFAALSLVALILSARVSRRWLVLALGVPAFMVQHALQGWCPPLAILRRLGFRTAKEINEERFALKALRGDFDGADHSNDSERILRAVKK